MEGDDDGEADDSHIDAQAEVREECWGSGGLARGCAGGGEQGIYFVHLRSDLWHRCRHFRRAGGRAAEVCRRRNR